MGVAGANSSIVCPRGTGAIGGIAVGRPATRPPHTDPGVRNYPTGRLRVTRLEPVMRSLS